MKKNDDQSQHKPHGSISTGNQDGESSAENSSKRLPHEQEGLQNVGTSVVENSCTT